jgi:transposase
MRYDLTDFEWSDIEPLLPMDRRGRKPQNNRQVLNGIFWELLAVLGAICSNAMASTSAYYSCSNRWRRAGLWDRLMDAIVTAHDGKAQMIDSSTVRVQQHAIVIADKGYDADRVAVRATKSHWRTPLRLAMASTNRAHLT